MGMKPRITANTKPLQPPKPPPPPPSDGGKRRTPLAAFGTPFRVFPNPKYKGPAIAGYVFVTAWKVENTDDQIIRFLEISDKIKNVKHMFHGTKARNIEAICEQGLRPGRASCMFGRGIYMGGPEKAIGYTSNGYSRSEAHYLLEVEVALGNLKPCAAAEKHSLETLEAQGYNSVGGFANMTASWSGTLRHNEYVVYDPDQVIVHRILEYHRDSTYSARPGVPIQTQGICEILREKPVVSNKNTFADVLNRATCGNISYTPVNARLDHGTKMQKNASGIKTLWICKECIDRLKLRVGSKVEVKTSAWSKANIGTYRLI
jgi:hypothetical protein